MSELNEKIWKEHVAQYRAEQAELAALRELRDVFGKYIDDDDDEVATWSEVVAVYENAKAAKKGGDDGIK